MEKISLAVNNYFAGLEGGEAVALAEGEVGELAAEPEKQQRWKKRQLKAILRSQKKLRLNPHLKRKLLSNRNRSLKNPKRAERLSKRNNGQKLIGGSV